MSGWGFIPSVERRITGPPTFKLLGRMANFPNITADPFMEEGHPLKQSAIKKGRYSIYCVWILLIFLTCFLSDLNIMTTSRSL